MKCLKQIFYECYIIVRIHNTPIKIFVQQTFFAHTLIVHMNLSTGNKMHISLLQVLSLHYCASKHFLSSLEYVSSSICDPSPFRMRFSCIIKFDDGNDLTQPHNIIRFEKVLSSKNKETHQLYKRTFRLIRSHPSITSYTTITQIRGIQNQHDMYQTSSKST